MIEWVERIENVLAATNPIVQGQSASTVYGKRADSSSAPKPSEVDMWLQIACALVTEARDDQDEDRFESWMGRLAQLGPLPGQWQARLAHERCLWALYRLDNDMASEALSQWPSSAFQFPIWETRRAAVLAEIGDVTEAEKIAEGALSMLRSKPSDFRSLSQEGWTMLLLRFLKSRRVFDNDDLDEYRDRWARLDAYSCNPWRELEILEALTLQPRPPMISRGLVRGFDPGDAHAQFQLRGSSLEDAMPAFALLRMFELGAVPSRIRGGAVHANAVSAAAEWIQPFAPLWSISARLRTGHKQTFEFALSRAKVAALTDKAVLYLFRLAYQGLKRSLRDASSGRQRSVEADSTIELFGEVLTRMAFRVTQEHRRDIVHLVLETYEVLAVSPPRYIAVDAFLHRALLGLPPDDLRRAIQKIAELPIPDQPIFLVGGMDRWPEASSHIPIPGEEPAASDKAAQLPSVEMLLRTATSGSPHSRSRALSRLIMLYRAHMLNPDQSRQFGLAIWSRRDQATGLPAESPVYGFSYLGLPEPQPGFAISALKDYVLKGDFPRAVTVATDGQGKTTRTIAHRILPEYMMTILRASSYPFGPNGQRNGRIDWSHDEARLLLERAVHWWDDEKAHVIGRRHVFGDPLGGEFSSLARIIGLVLLPRLSPHDADTASVVTRVLGEMNERGVITDAATPFLLYLSPSDVDAIAARMSLGLQSAEAERVGSAAEGLAWWMIHSAARRIPKPPEDLTLALLHSVESRRLPALRRCIEYVSFVIAEIPGYPPAAWLRGLSVALDYLRAETAIRPTAPESHVSVAQTETIPFEDRPEIRAAAAQLARRLAASPSADMEPLRQSIAAWREEAATDPFPEVRLAWA